MTMQICVPAETTACALGADRVATAITETLARQGKAGEVRRTGSRGAFFLEPLVEVVHGGARLGFGPVRPEDVAALFADGEPPSRRHPLCVGDPDQLPWLAAQTRLTFARVGKLEPLDFAGYAAMGGLTALRTALGMPADEVIAAIAASGLRYMTKLLEWH